MLSVHMRGVGERSSGGGGWWLLPAILRASPLIFLLIILRETPVINGKKLVCLNIYRLKMQVNCLRHGWSFGVKTPLPPSITDTRSNIRLNTSGSRSSSDFHFAGEKR